MNLFFRASSNVYGLTIPMFRKSITYPALKRDPLQRLTAVMFLLLLSACASESVRKADLLATLSSLERTPARDPVELGDIDILALSEDARRFIKRRVEGIREPYERVRAIRSAVFSDEGLGFLLDNELTLTASETFEQAGGNCVALANFFVAAVRHAGMNAQYQELERKIGRKDEDTDGEGRDFRVIERHINVSGSIIWNGRQARYVLDYLTVPEEDFGRSRVISDKRAFAHYYNNHAVGYLQNGDIEKAVQYLKKAILQAPDVDFVWSNLGVVYARRGDYEAAEFSYGKALDLNRENPSARRNLQELLGKWDRGKKVKHE